MGWLSKINPLNLIDSISDAYQVRQQTKAQRIEAKTKEVIADIKGRVEIHEAKKDLKLAKIKAETEQVAQESEQASNYDMQVLRNRAKSPTDDILIASYIVLYAAHFIPATQPYMLSGWKAMGYQGAPWWLELGMVIIMVSTLGGMQVLRIFMAKKKPSKEGD